MSPFPRLSLAGPGFLVRFNSLSPPPPVVAPQPLPRHFGSALRPARPCDFNFAPSLYHLPFPSSFATSLFICRSTPAPTGRSLISISSRRVENIARVSSYARRTRECQIPSFVLHFAGLDGEAKADTKYTRNVRYRELYCLCINDRTYVRTVRYEG